MIRAHVGYVRKRDFQIAFDLHEYCPPLPKKNTGKSRAPVPSEPYMDDPVVAEQLANSVRVVRTSRLHTVLLLEIAYPDDGLVHQTIDLVCRNGIRQVRYDSLHPSRKTSDAAQPGHVSYIYDEGTITDQYAVSSRDDNDADDPMVDVLQILFQNRSIVYRQWIEDAPKLRLVTNDGLASVATDNQITG